MKYKNVKPIRKSSSRNRTLFVLLGLILLIPFQNCQNQISVADQASKALSSVLTTDPEQQDPTEPAGSEPISPSNPEVPVIPTQPPGVPPVTTCQLISCELTPITAKPAVTTILLALGDEANQQLVIDGGSAQLIAETVVRYTTPVSRPKILVIKDRNSGDEDPEDFNYLKSVLLSRYDVTVIEEGEHGVSLEEMNNYDLIWLNNPGNPMGSVNTKNALIEFKGGVVLQGDDLTRGSEFSTEDLTRLKHIDNGEDISCGDQSVHIDNNDGAQYAVSMNSQFFPSATDNTPLSFVYGNDIDNSSVVVGAEVEVLATAKGNSELCEATRPAIVRYFKNSAP